MTPIVHRSSQSLATSPAACPDPVDTATLPRRFVTVHGYRRAYVLCGSGPAVLLLHGIGDNADTWRPVIGELAEHYTVIAPDLLGHGQSDRPRADYSIAAYACGMRDLLSVLDVDRVSVIGHSLGGGVGMQFAYQFPERCERLVLVSSGGAGRQTNQMLRFIAIPGAESVLPLLAVPGTRQFVAMVMFALRVFGADIGRDTADLARLFESFPDRTARSAFLRTLRGSVDRHGQVITMLDRCYLAEGIPTLLIWGARDAVIPVAHGRVLNSAMTRSRLEVFPDAGHFPHRSNPDQFLAVVREFLSETAPASYDAAQWRKLLRRGPAATAVAETLEA
ncbi:MAG TPA: alpha/beta fold hydrolase [Sporichthyaceae bacterium]|jgi:pimeloyl-ACP methyl ester carboxylesterase|nr:alpha/beta fold hydrolase [Sporichthyaceae bacterium]